MIQLNGEPLSLQQLEAIAVHNEPVQLADDAVHRMAASRGIVESIIARGEVVYGVNTGFGKLSNVTIPTESLEALQLNLIRSHACGVGEAMSSAETRAMAALRINVLAAGYSGARPAVAEALVASLNANVLPRIPRLGSVGASGDLAPLAHLALGLIGEGMALHDGEWLPASDALRRSGLQPVTLQAKEGLALINGTQAIGAVGGLALARGLRALDAATLAGAMTLEALKGSPTPFEARIHVARRHPGQIKVAAQLTQALEGSAIRESHRTNDPRVQDAYCLRCMPQVHGAVMSALEHAQSILEAETGAATDNPLVFAADGDVISCGNFHACPLAYALDYAAIALTDLASIAERRIDRLVNPDSSEGLPAFLAGNAGLESGFMIPHVVAAALLNECKVLAHPASIDNVPTSGGKEDHVSMGMTSANKLRQIVDRLERVVAIELLAAAEGLEYRRPLRSSATVERVHELVRSMAPKLTGDRSLSEDIEAIAAFIRANRLATL